MNAIINLFSTVFNLLISSTVFDVPVLVWLVLPAIIILIINFVKGEK